MIRTLLKPFSFVPALLLMYMIYSFSAQPGEVSSQLSYKVSYKIVETVDQTLNADMADWEIDTWVYRIHGLVRKLAHMTEYFALAVAVSFPLYVYGVHGIWLMLLAGIICVGFACGDEYHQSFVEGRGPSVRDVAIDSFGVFWGIILVRIVGWTGRKTIFRPRKKKKQKETRKQTHSEQTWQEPQRHAYSGQTRREPQRHAYSGQTWQEPQRHAYSDQAWQEPQQHAYSDQAWQEPQQHAYSNQIWQEPQQRQRYAEPMQRDIYAQAQSTPGALPQGYPDPAQQNAYAQQFSPRSDAQMPDDISANRPAHLSDPFSEKPHVQDAENMQNRQSRSDVVRRPHPTASHQPVQDAQAEEMSYQPYSQSYYRAEVPHTPTDKH